MSVTTSRMTRHIIIALSFLLSGCVFHDYSAPQVEGSLTHAGKPLAGVTVSLTEFERPIATAKTDSNGHFSLAPQGNWQVFIPVGPQDRVTDWSLTTIDRQGKERRIYSEHRLGGPFSGYSKDDRVKLTCELSPAGGESESQNRNLYCDALPVSHP